MTQSKHWDIIIIGGGIVGLTMACGLAPLNLEIAIVESQLPQTTWPEGSYDIRVSAINRASQNILQALNLWTEIEKLGICSYQKMQVWDAGGTGKINFACTELGQANLGHIVENRILQKVLLEHLSQYSNCQIIAPARPEKLIIRSEKINLHLDNGEHLTSKLLVGADGPESWVRKKTHITLKTWPYEQSAIVTNVRTELPHELTAWQRFLNTGPIAFLPFADPHLCSIVWSTSSKEAEMLMRMDDAAFNAACGHALESKLGAVEAIDKRLSFPLHMRHAKQYVKPGVALIGDAAHTLHPLAGQGINLGLLDAACLIQVLKDALAKDRDIASMHTLRRYERWRKGENLLMIAAMEGFKRLFGSRSTSLIQLRNLGLKITDKQRWFKSHFMRRAIGITGDLPPLALSHRKT